jgi:hypothetical protein
LRCFFDAPCAIISSVMSEPPPSDVLGALPRTRPQRRSPKRAGSPAATASPAAATPPAAAVPPAATASPAVAAVPPPRPEPSAAPAPRTLLGTAVQAAAELTEIGLSAGARALRGAVSRLPRP